MIPSTFVITTAGDTVRGSLPPGYGQYPCYEFMLSVTDTVHGEQVECFTGTFTAFHPGANETVTFADAGIEGRLATCEVLQPNAERPGSYFVSAPQNIRGEVTLDVVAAHLADTLRRQVDDLKVILRLGWGTPVALQCSII